MESEYSKLLCFNNSQTIRTTFMNIHYKMDFRINIENNLMTLINNHNVYVKVNLNQFLDFYNFQ